MSAQVLDGRLCAKAREAVLRQRLQALAPVVPGLAVVLVGDDPASMLYVTRKRQACERVGIHSRVYHHPVLAPDALLALIDDLNADSEVHGILVQLPLPDEHDHMAVLERINPMKDVDGFHPYTVGRLLQCRPMLRPCTPMGVMQLLAWAGCQVAGQHAVVVGASNIVGRPMALELLQARATVTVCHQQTQRLANHIASADILVSATGNRQAIDSHWIQPGAVVVDVGIHRDGSGVVQGDLDHAVAAERARWLTPVPGGVGPMTISALLENTLLACESQQQQ